jgi:hypothetical protein
MSGRRLHIGKLLVPIRGDDQIGRREGTPKKKDRKSKRRRNRGSEKPRTALPAPEAYSPINPDPQGSVEP